MKVNVPSPLRSYTGGENVVKASGSTLGGVLEDLNQRYPGIRFRMIDEQGGIRPHIRLFVNQELEADLGRAVGEGDEVHIICALSGGRVA